MRSWAAGGVDASYRPLDWQMLCREWRLLLVWGAVALAVMCIFLPWGVRLSAGCVLTMWLVALAVLDWRRGLLYDRLVVPLGLAGVLAALAGVTVQPVQALLGALLSGSFLWGLRMISRGGLGLGDVKLGFALGLWLGWQAALIALLLSFIMGGLVACALLLLRHCGKDAALPFGPFLAAGAYLAYIFGAGWWQMYEALL